MSKQCSEWDSHRITIQIIIIPRHDTEVEGPNTRKLRNNRISIASVLKCKSFTQQLLWFLCSLFAVSGRSQGHVFWVSSVTPCCSHEESNTGQHHSSHGKVVTEGWLNVLEVSAFVPPVYPAAVGTQCWMPSGVKEWVDEKYLIRS